MQVIAVVRHLCGKEVWGAASGMRYVLISFAFMAFVFYEMSGGADFDAEALRLSRIDVSTIDTNEPARTETIAKELPTPDQQTTPAPLDLAVAEEVAESAPDLAEPADARVPAIAPELTEPPRIVLPSLINSDASITQVDFGSKQEPIALAPAPAPQLPIREVTGDRVNVRGGPGTGFSVINSLVRGDKVEILANPGDGWVQLRPVDGGPVGWMAEFLLSEG